MIRIVHDARLNSFIIHSTSLISDDDTVSISKDTNRTKKLRKNVRKEKRTYKVGSISC